MIFSRFTSITLFRDVGFQSAECGFLELLRLRRFAQGVPFRPRPQGSEGRSFAISDIISRPFLGVELPTGSANPKYAASRRPFSSSLPCTPTSVASHARTCEPAALLLREDLRTGDELEVNKLRDESSFGTAGFEVQYLRGPEVFFLCARLGRKPISTGKKLS